MQKAATACRSGRYDHYDGGPAWSQSQNSKSGALFCHTISICTLNDVRMVEAFVQSWIATKRCAKMSIRKKSNERII